MPWHVPTLYMYKVNVGSRHGVTSASPVAFTTRPFFKDKRFEKSNLDLIEDTAGVIMLAKNLLIGSKV